MKIRYFFNFSFVNPTHFLAPKTQIALLAPEGVLPSNSRGSGLGKFKLEACNNEIVFLGPKIFIISLIKI